MTATEFEALYQEHHSYLMGVAYNHLRDRVAAEDVISETFLRAWSHRESYQETGKARQWLVMICLNLIRNVYRDKAARPVWCTLRDSQAQTRSAPLEEFYDVQRALKQLPARQQVALAYAVNHIRGQHKREPAKIRAIIRRARQRLRALVSD